jgi:ABC-type sugar transport system permease subunit
MLMRDLISGLVMVLLGLALVFWVIPAGTSVPYSADNLAHSPSFWPRFLAIILLLAGSVLALKNFSNVANNTSMASVISESLHSVPGRFWMSLLMLIPYYIACLKFGLLIPSMVAFMAYALLAGERSYGVLLLAGVLMPLTLTLFFIHFANVLIPLGPLLWLM